MKDKAEQYAVRNTVAISESPEVICLRIYGQDTFSLLNKVCSRDMYVRDSKMLHALFLTDSGLPFADVYVCRDDDELVLLVDGPDYQSLSKYLEDHSQDLGDYQIEYISQTHRLIDIDGPWAWELLASVIGPEIIGLPYLSFYYSESLMIFRSGKTGEYGYSILVPESDRGDFLERLQEKGRPLDARIVGSGTLGQCALENFFFNIRREGCRLLSPLELQLQWRLSTRKPYAGQQAVASLKAKGPAIRVTTAVSDSEPKPGQRIRHEGKDVGSVLTAGYSHTINFYVVQLLLAIEYAYPRLSGFLAENDGATSKLVTVSPPVINNLSLNVNPNIHSYATRELFDFPDPGSLFLENQIFGASRYEKNKLLDQLFV